MVKRTHGEKTAYDQRNGACEKETKTMQTQRFAKKLYFYRNLFQKAVDKIEARW